MSRSQADINTNMDMIAARRRERDFFSASPDYGHLASKMGSSYLAKLLSKVLPLLFIFGFIALFFNFFTSIFFLCLHGRICFFFLF